MVTGITIYNDLWVFLFVQISLAVELPRHLHLTLCPPPVWGQLGDSYLVSTWKTPVVTLFQNRGSNYEHIQGNSFHLDILCWH